MASGVEFDEDKMGFPPRPAGGMAGVPGMNAAPASYGGQGYAGQARGFAGWLISHGWVKSKRAAQFILLGVVCANIIITIIVLKLFL